MTAPEQAYTVRIGVGVALLSVALMTTEIVLTRIFSVLVWYHFAFFAISVALFGLGASALMVHLLQHRIPAHESARLISAGCLVFALAIVGVDLALMNLGPDWFGAGSSNVFTALTFKLFVLFLLAQTPFFCGGLALSLAVLRYRSELHRVYSWDLLGAGAGCALVIPLLSAFGAPLALVFAGLVAVLAAAAFASREPGRAVNFATALTGVAIFLILILSPRFGWLQIRMGKGIALESTPVEYNRWNSFSMVTVLPSAGFSGWGVSPLYRGRLPEQKTLVIDLNAMTPLNRFSGTFEDVSYVSYDLSAFVYHLKPHSAAVFVIGAGGGKDVLAALASGARLVTAAEINPLIVNDVVRGKYRDFVGGLYDRPDVRIIVDDGRSAIRKTDGLYDVIQLSMVDTSAATAAGAYALTENSLYTIDAFHDFLRHLRPGGVLSVASVSLPELAVGARLTTIAWAALARTGTDPARSVAVFQTRWLGLPGATMYNVLVRPDGWPDLELRHMSRRARELGFGPVHVPGTSAGAPGVEAAAIRIVLGTRDRALLERTLSSWPLDVSATTDDRPFFFYQNRLRDLPRVLLSSGPAHLFGNGLAILAKVALLAAVLVGLFLLMPLLLQRSELARERAGLGSELGYAACLGLGFMFVEIPLIQRFALYLGNPTFTLSVVLFVLLVMGGVGSRILARADGQRPQRTRLAMLGLVVYTLTFGFFGKWLLDATWGFSGVSRAVIAASVLAPVGFMLGAPLPAGLSAIGERTPRRIPWLWSINSAASVMGSIFATLVALHAGIAATLASGMALYAVALALSFRVFPSRERA